MRYGSVCSGIEAASAAWQPLGWKLQWLAEIDPFCNALLAHHYPEAHNYGNFADITAAAPAIDLLVGGTPCQGFSVAGLRGGLDDARSNLALEYIRLASRLRPRWVVWENVPGVLSSGPSNPHTGERIKGYDFALLLGGFTGVVPTIPKGGWGNAGIATGPLYNVAWRVLDAQYFGVPQRRRRVFLVGYFGDWRPAAAVLFERDSLRGHSKAGRRSREVVAALTADGVGTCGADDNQAQAGHLIARLEPDAMPVIAATVQRGNNGGFRTEPGEHLVVTPRVAAPLVARQAKGCFTDPVNDNLLVAPVDLKQVTSNVNRTRVEYGSPANTLHQSGQAIAFAWQQGSNPNGGRESIVRAGDYSGSISATRQDAIAGSFGVRRLTPTECERLMGFPDSYSLVPYRNKPASDSSRYRALGNSMAVPCMAWLGQHIQAVDDIMDTLSRKLEEAS